MTVAVINFGAKYTHSPVAVIDFGAQYTQLIARRGQLIHPNGWSFDSSTVSGFSPTLAELENASAWTRKHSVKKSQILFLTTN